MGIFEMKIDDKKVEHITEMRKTGLDDAKIQEYLDLDTSVEDFLKKYEEEKDLLTVEQAAEYLAKHLKKNNDEKTAWNKNKVLRLLDVKRGRQIKPYKDNPAKKEGYKIHVTELERFVKEYKMTTGDWKKQVIALEEENQKLKEELAKLKENAAKAEKQKTRVRKTKADTGDNANEQK